MCIDTETTGLPKRDLPADHPDQPSLAVFCAIPLNQDLQEDGPRFLCAIKPDGWTVPAEMEAINGLTTELLEETGRPVEVVLDYYSAAIDQGRVILAYGAGFDCKIMRGALRRAGRDDLIHRTQVICAMKALGGRWKKLRVACAEFGIQGEDEHTAWGDAAACVEIARKLRQSGRLPRPYTLEKREP